MMFAFKVLSRKLSGPINLHSKAFRTHIMVMQRVIEVVPALGESITEGTISKWMKNEGELVNVDDVIAVVETDKVTVDIKSSYKGVLSRQLAKDTVNNL